MQTQHYTGETRLDTAEDGAEAWVGLNEMNHNLLITDHDVSRLTGMELITPGRLTEASLPVVLDSNSLHPVYGLAREGPELDAFLLKPFDSFTLVETAGHVHRATNNLRQNSGVTIPSFANLARSAQPYMRGGINE